MKPVDRRHFLRGSGAFLTLPWLESLAQRPDAPPCRLVVVYVPNGIHMPDWLPGEGAAAGELPFVLEPFAPLRREIQVLTGLTHDKARSNGDGPGDHARAAAAFLTGAQPYKSPGDRIFVGPSMDQVAARAVGNATRLRSLELGCEPGRRSGQCDSGYACVYSGSIAWADATTPLMKETKPRAVFERMFRGPESGTPAERARRRSVLDLVREDAAALRRRVSRGDARRVDEYLEGVRELERRIARAETDAATAGAAGGVEGVEPPPTRPADYGEHVRLMNELVVLALAGDVTRVVTFMHADEGSNRSYPMLDVPEGHHATSHHGGDPEKIEKIRRINRWHTEAHAELLRRLHETPEGEGSLLDHSMVLYGSGISDGNRHDHADLPLLLAGRGCGTLQPGTDRAFPRETPAMNLHLALLERMGAGVARLGDGSEPLAL